MASGAALPGASERLALPTLLLAAATLVWWVAIGTPDTFYWSSLVAAAGGLAIAAVAQTFILASGSQGLGGGAMISLVNVLVVTFIADDPVAIGGWVVAGPLLGAVVGAINGVLVGFLRLSSVAVTLATSFVLYGATLLFLDNPAPPPPASFMRLVTGEIVPGLLPAALVVIVVVVALAEAAFRSGPGRRLRAVGADAEAAARAGLPVGLLRMAAHVAAGAGYGLAGVFVSAVTGSADPLIGAPSVLQIYAAVAIGGVAVGRSGGGPLNAALGALVVASVVNLLFLFDVGIYWSTAIEGLLIVAGLLVSRSIFTLDLARVLRGGGAAGPRSPGTPARLAPDYRRLVLPCLGVACVAGATFAFDAVDQGLAAYGRNLFVASAFLILLGTGQAVVMLAGGLDLSLPATMALSASLFAVLVAGADETAILATPVILLAGAAIGAVNGLAIALTGIRPIFVTLAMAGLLQAVGVEATFLSNERYASEGLLWLMHGSVLGVPPILPVLLLFIAALGLAERTGAAATARAFARSALPSTDSVWHLGSVLIGAYALAGAAAAAAGILASGELSDLARFGVGDTYLLPAIAAAVLGGVAMTGGRGSLMGAAIGATLVTSLSILLQGAGVHYGMARIAIGILLVLLLTEGSAEAGSHRPRNNAVRRRCTALHEDAQAAAAPGERPVDLDRRCTL